MRELLSDVSVARSMNTLLQFAEDAEYVGDVGKTIVTGSVNKMKSKNGACTVRDVIMSQQSVQKNREEVNMNKTRAEKCLSYAEAAEIMERNEEMVAA